LTVKSGYGEIRKLREDGFGYDVICGECAEKGVLPACACPKNLCSAFLRETKRREEKALAISEVNRGEITKTSAGGFASANGKIQKAVAPPAPAFPAREKLAVNPDNTFNIRPNSLSESDIEETERIRRKLHEESYDSGRGFRITKHSDGSFDYE
ncbi:MAG: hypothetical protein LBS53_11265, partial [Synergistaceae bacterium]|nr:hypothetical protein [Synergistaceae bacterium]